MALWAGLKRRHASKRAGPLMRLSPGREVWLRACKASGIAVRHLPPLPAGRLLPPSQHLPPTPTHALLLPPQRSISISRAQSGHAAAAPSSSLPSCTLQRRWETSRRELQQVLTHSTLPLQPVPPTASEKGQQSVDPRTRVGRSGPAQVRAGQCAPTRCGTPPRSCVAHALAPFHLCPHTHLCARCMAALLQLPLVLCLRAAMRLRGPRPHASISPPTVPALPSLLDHVGCHHLLPHQQQQQQQ